MSSAPLPADAARDWRAWTLIAILALLPFGAAAELPVLVAAVAMLATLHRVDWRAPANRLVLVVFAAYWVPELLSAFDSYDARKSWTEVAADLRFVLLLLFAVRALHDAARVRFVFAGFAAIALLWCLDAVVQALTGWSLGGAAQADRLSGIFGDDNLKLGGVVAVLSPFVLACAWGGGIPVFPATTLPRSDDGTRRSREPARGSREPARRSREGGSPGAMRTVLALALLLTVVLLAGARAAWIVLAVAVTCLATHRLGGRRALLALTAAMIAAMIAIAAANTLSPRFAERLDRTAAALRGDAEAIDYAVSHRLPIWRTALAMTAAHPLNGVGVRAFREAYADHAAPGDYWLDPAHGDGAFHAHQWLLEVASETGLPGLLAWFAGIAVALRAWLRASREARARAVAPACALAAMLFPLNTHYAVYSTFWSLLLFLLLATWIAALHASRE